MADAISIQELIDARTDAKTLEEAVNGDAVTTVLSRLGETYPTLSNALNQIDSKLDSAETQIKQGITNLFENGGLPATPFATKALMTASALTDGQYAMVTDDTVNNGLYVKTSGAWVKSSYDPLTQAKEYTDTAKTAAISAAASDATTKANTAKTDAIAASKVYTDDKDKNSAKLRIGKNLFNTKNITSDYNLSVSGVPIVSAGTSISEFIAVKPNTAYSFTATASACFYDANKNFLSRSAGANANVISDANAAFVRVAVATVNLNKAQVEQSTSQTIYEPFAYTLEDNLVDTTSIKNQSITNDKVKNLTLNANKLDDVVWLNMHDATKLVKGFTLSLADGSAVASASNDITEYIPCRPSTVHTSPRFIRVAFYDINKTFISLSPDIVFTTPSNCHYIRFSLSNLTSNSFQANEGSTVPQTVPQPHKYSLSNMSAPKPTYKELAATRGRLYSFTDAWIAWKNGEKFPIAFLGDSTTQGVGTSTAVARAFPYVHDVDYISPKSYPSVFQALIREATGNTAMRAYNAGFSGTTADYGLANFDEIFSGVYADVKMIGISFGINDRKANANSYKLLYLPKIEALIQKCLDRGIQPFLLTSQPVTIPYWGINGGGSAIEEVGNNYKRELANKYNLEIIDVSKYGELFMQYSIKPLLNNIMEAGSNVIHFGDAGHKFTAELLFAHFCKRVIWAYNEGERLDYSTQKMDSSLMHTELSQFSTPNNGFKLGVNKTQETATDLLYQDFYVFNAGRKQLNLTAYYANAAVGQYAVVDGTQTTITTQGQELGTLDLGLHKIKAYSSATTALDWLGFKLTPTA